jgi:large subunit ribosomal protein L10
MKASMAKAAAVFNALPVQMAQLAEALRAKLEAEAGAAAPPADAAAPDGPEDSAPAETPDATADDAPAAEAPDAETASE